MENESLILKAAWKDRSHAIILILAFVLVSYIYIYNTYIY